MKLINKYQNGGKKVHIIGIGSDADSKSLELLNKVDTDKFFGEEVKKFNNKSELQPHEAGAVLDYIFNIVLLSSINAIFIFFLYIFN